MNQQSNNNNNTAQSSADDITLIQPETAPPSQPSMSSESPSSFPSTATVHQGDETNEPPPPPCSEAETKLRRKILDIQRDSSLSAKEKARRIQQLMWQGTRTSPMQPGACCPGSSDPPMTISDGHSVTYQDEKQGIMGCPHYQRKCKLQADCCGQLFGCRFCHDDQSDHAIVRTDTKNMYCMLCQRLQPAGPTCVGCDQSMARYYCDKCKLWDDVPDKAIYHCDDCGMCRQGQGLGKDFFHCATCHICMSISMQHKHRCIERNLESDCPICGEYMFTSTATVIFMPCGHCIHKHCYTKYIETSYQCPTCMKSLGDMSNYFARLDRELERHSMPDEYTDVLSHVFCNDCERRCATKYHFFYHKCSHCASYNTTVLRTENTKLTTPSMDDSSSSSSSSSSPTSLDDPGLEPNSHPLEESIHLDG